MDEPEVPSPGAVVPAAGGATDAPASVGFGVGPRQAAVALAYARDGAAPKVVAKGRGLLAQAIIERARAHGVFVHESRDLVALLLQVDLDRRIPPELYRAVAELLAWVYRLEQQHLLPALPAASPTQRSLPDAPLA